TAAYNDIDTFVFDEIDAGISGKTAGIVAEKFIAISKKVQVIAITHLPQISAAADNNLLIEKHETAEKTITKVVCLDEKGKLSEIIRLVGGDEKSESSIKHAKEMIEKAKALK
ncbi:MAG: DNA repair protein RecN, partial [Clostridia bacterium]|nr:DNA repair protein RecN [Clostridia bacterium]